MAISERAYLALRMHQHRVAARLTCEDLDTAAGWTSGTCFKIEYRQAGTAAQIRRAIALFDPQRRELKRPLASRPTRETEKEESR